MGVVDGISYPDLTDLVDNLNGTLAVMAQSIANAKPVKVATTLTQLNGWTGAAYPEGTLAVVSTASSGMDRGAVFLRSGGVWIVASGIKLTDLATFITAIKGFTNVFTWAGQTFYDVASETFGIWNDDSASYRLLVDSSWVGIPYVSGTKERGFGYALAYKMVPGGVRLRGGVRNNSGNFKNGQLIAQLPDEARPSAGIQVNIPGATWSTANVQINSDGTVKIYGIMNVNSPWFSFDNVFIPLSEWWN